MSIDSFRTLIGQAFALDGVDIELTLTEIDERHATSFSLLFEGPVDNIVPQRIYELRKVGQAADDAEESMSIFIVPLGPGSSGNAVYEAAFNGPPPS